MGATTTIHGSILAEPSSVPQIVQDICDDLTSQGYTVVDFGIGNTASIFPMHVAAHWVMDEAGGRDVAQAVKDTAARHSGMIGAWTNWVIDIAQDVVVPTIEDAAGDVKTLGTDLAIGSLLLTGALVVGAGVVLVLMARAGAFQSLRFA
jgi:hypothetical protein